MGNVEILLATYNGENYLRAQLDSIFNQTYQDFSLSVRDDGSTDQTVQILNEYSSKYPGKIKILDDHLEHRGATLSFGYLIEHSTSEYIMLCDQDDVWLSKKIEITLERFNQLEKEYPRLPLMVFTDLKEVDENLNVIHESFINSQKLFPEIITSPVKVLALNVVAGCTMMINKTAKQFILPIPVPNIIHDQWIAANISHFGKITYLPVATLLYRQHNFNAVGSNRIGFKYFFNKLLKPSKQFKIYRGLISNLEFRVSFVSFFYYKIYFTIKRFTIKPIS
ncbi:MAG TPA: glycosyltransferase family 2 protein [Mucilaginibacter sp.]|jgi:glycosyltransferase involved in cell wall biosynthesis|nr:glycosyltransferase family 2 protein [Mucilaginibacter sp.]